MDRAEHDLHLVTFVPRCDPLRQLGDDTDGREEVDGQLGSGCVAAWARSGITTMSAADEIGPD